MLTLNEQRARSGDKGINPGNPRAKNEFGHIVEITPDGGDHAAAAFRWDFLLQCGDPAIAEVGATFNALTTRDRRQQTEQDGPRGRSVGAGDGRGTARHVALLLSGAARGGAVRAVLHARFGDLVRGRAAPW
jgi:hypothetical protein